MEAKPDTPDSDESYLAFDLLNADDPSAMSSDGATPRLRRREFFRQRNSCVKRDWGTRAGSSNNGTTPGVRQPLLRTIYQELSQLAVEADGVSEKVKRTINRQRQRLQALIEDTTTAPRRLQYKIAAPLDKRRKEFHGKIRKAVTGDERKSLRLHLEEKRSKPPVMRMMDKAAFTVGVLTLIVSEYMLLEMPERFWLWYSVMIPVLLTMRYPSYVQRKWQFFYLDFCYYVQVCCILGIFFMPHDCRLQTVIFMYSMGPLSWAVPLWRNSLVFHDVDKMTSCFIHLFPSWLSLTLRWCPLDTLRGGEQSSAPECTNGVNGADIAVSICLYLIWQVLYYIKTEHHEKLKLDADPDIQTSLRWLTTTPKNPLHRGVLFLARKAKVMRKDETFDPATNKTKIIFMGSQLVYTIIVSIPTPFMYNSKAASIGFAFFMFVCALWNSSNYYIDVFSRKYWQSLEAVAAAKAEALVAKRDRAMYAAAAGEGTAGNEGGQAEDGEALERGATRSYSGVSVSSGEDGGSWSLATPTAEEADSAVVVVVDGGGGEIDAATVATMSFGGEVAGGTSSGFAKNEGMEDVEGFAEGEGHAEDIGGASVGIVASSVKIDDETPAGVGDVFGTTDGGKEDGGELTADAADNGGEGSEIHAAARVGADVGTKEEPEPPRGKCKDV